MRFPFVKKIQTNENGGIVMMMCIMLLVVLTIVGITSIHMSSNEGNIVRNEQISATELYKAETGLNIARLQFSDWMTNKFMFRDEGDDEAWHIIYYNADSTGYKKYYDPTDPNKETDRGFENLGAGMPYTAKLQIRNIVDYEETPSNYKEVFEGGIADKIPSLRHSGTPPAGTGYSATKFQIRRFSITVTTDTGAVVQAGVWKAFGNYN